MKVRFLDRVEDSHPVVETVDGKPRVRNVVGKFRKGELADLPKDQAEKLLNLGYVEKV